MLHFESDYVQGAHEAVLQALMATNTVAASGYGTDPFTLSAIRKINEACHRDDLQVTLLSGGTQTNAIVIDSLLRSYEGVLTADTGHINVYEAGAIEYTGHKVIALPHSQGKLTASVVHDYLETFHSNPNSAHMVLPGMVYISQPTEYGTIYSKQELKSLSKVCQRYNIPLFIDGARLGYGLVADGANVTLAELASLCDVFYIGGTKVGALCGEAVVFTKRNQPANFVRMLKKHGALLAKGRLIGVQFDALFTDDLYWHISRHAINLAKQLKHLLQQKGYTFYMESPTNQQFVLIEESEYERLKQFVCVGYGVKHGDQILIRFATSWSTTQEDIDRLAALL